MKSKILALLLISAMTSALVVGCGKDTPVKEEVTMQTMTDDIYAEEGETVEKKEEEKEEVVQVDTDALLKNALTGITAVRMNTAINVSALPTSIKTETPSVDELVREYAYEDAYVKFVGGVEDTLNPKKGDEFSSIVAWQTSDGWYYEYTLKEATGEIDKEGTPEWVDKDKESAQVETRQELLDVATKYNATNVCLPDETKVDIETFLDEKAYDELVQEHQVDASSETSSEEGSTLDSEVVKETDTETVSSEESSKDVKETSKDAKDTTTEKDKTEKITEKAKEYDTSHSNLDMKSTPSEKKNVNNDTSVVEKSNAEKTESSEDTDVEVSESETQEAKTETVEIDAQNDETEQTPVFTPTDESSYYVNLKVTTDIDTTKAKTYGKLNMNLGAIVEKEYASYVDFSYDDAIQYEVKHSIEEGADEKGNVAEEVATKWYKTASDFYGLATIKEILETANFVSYNETVDSHVISLEISKDMAKKLDVTNSMIDILFEGKTTVPITVYLTKADGIITRLVVTMTDFKGALSNTEVQTNNYVITFEKYNSINKVMIPDTILEGAQEITGEENFISDEDLVKYNFEKLAIEEAMQSNTDVSVTSTDEDKATNESSEITEIESKDKKDTDKKSDDKESDDKESANEDETLSDADKALKATQQSKTN